MARVRQAGRHGVRPLHEGPLGKLTRGGELRPSGHVWHGPPPPRVETTPPRGRWGKLPSLRQSRAVDLERRARRERERLTRAFGDPSLWPLLQRLADGSSVHVQGSAADPRGYAWVGPEGEWLAFAPLDSFAAVARTPLEQLRLARARALGARDVGLLTLPEVRAILDAAPDPLPLERPAPPPAPLPRRRGAEPRRNPLVDRARQAEQRRRDAAEQRAAERAAAIRAERQAQRANYDAILAEQLEALARAMEQA